MRLTNYYTNISVEKIFMNSENSKTSEPQNQEQENTSKEMLFYPMEKPIWQIQKTIIGCCY